MISSVKSFSFLVIVLVLSALAGCGVTPPAAPTPADPSVYRPSSPISYPPPSQ